MNNTSGQEEGSSSGRFHLFGPSPVIAWRHLTPGGAEDTAPQLVKQYTRLIPFQTG